MRNREKVTWEMPLRKGFSNKRFKDLFIPFPLKLNFYFFFFDQWKLFQSIFPAFDKIVFYSKSNKFFAIKLINKLQKSQLHNLLVLLTFTRFICLRWNWRQQLSGGWAWAVAFSARTSCWDLWVSGNRRVRQFGVFNCIQRSHNVFLQK